MALYLLEREDCGYDEYDAKLIRATSRDHARGIANKNAGAEGNIWLQDGITCTQITECGEAEEIIGSFKAG